MSYGIKQLRQKKWDLIAEGKAALDKAAAEGRDLTAAERNRDDAINVELETVGASITRVEKQMDRDRAALLARGPSGPGTVRWDGNGDRIHAPAHAPAGVIGYDPEGRPVRALGPKEKLADLVPRETGMDVDAEASTVGLADVVRGQVMGEWRSPEIQALAGSSTVGGNILLSAATSTMVIDLARSKACVVQAGARTVPMEAREVTIAKLATDPTAYWRPENAVLTASDPSFAGVVLRARTVGVLAKVPIELVEDAQNLSSFLDTVFSDALALEIDRVALVGTGAAEEPQGIENTPGVGTSTGIASPVYDDFTDMVKTVRLANGEPTAAIVHPRDVATLEKLKAVTDGQYLIPPASFTALNRLMTTQVPSTRGGGSNESLAFVGDFTQVLLGVRTNLTIEASRHAADSSSSAFANLQVWIRGYLRMDVAVVRPGWFVVGSGITA
ncbi:MAG: phage major capsid protein [Acidobacteriia bacterium]|nr:phage major capsid protein [Terriglobia bacterium]